MTLKTFLSTQRPDGIGPICARVFGAYILTAVMVSVFLGLVSLGTDLTHTQGFAKLAIFVLIFLIGGTYTGAFVFLPISLVWFAVARITGENLPCCAAFGVFTSVAFTLILNGFKFQLGMALATGLIGLAGGLIYWLLACGMSAENPETTNM